MLSKCANPQCDRRFLYLRGGRFIPLRMPVSAGGEPTRQELFWLCPQCAGSVELSIVDGGIVARPAAPLRRATSPCPEESHAASG